MTDNDMIKPQLQSDYQQPQLEELPQGTYSAAGVLVEKNAGWRIDTPIIDSDKCRNCLECYLYCPDGCIYKIEKSVAIDYDFCKGCLICQAVCPFKAISLKGDTK